MHNVTPISRGRGGPQDYRTEPAGGADYYRPPAPSEEEFNPLQLGALAWRNKGVIIGTTLLSIALAMFAYTQIEPQYTAQSQIRIEEQVRNVVNLDAVVAANSGDVDSILSEIQVMRSPELALRVIDTLDLRNNPEFNADLLPPTRFDAITSRLAGMLPASIAKHVPVLKDALEADEPIAGAPVTAEDADLAAFDPTDVGHLKTFRGSLSVYVVGKSRVIAINYTSTDPGLAAEISNTLAETYISAQVEGKYRATQQANSWLNARLEELREQVAQGEEAIEDYRAEVGLINADAVTVASQQVALLSQQLITAQAEKAAAEARLEEAEALLNSANADATSDVLNSLLISRLREQEAQILKEIALLRQNVGPGHPDMVRAQSQLAGLRGNIGGEISKITEALRNEVNVINARISTLEEELQRQNIEVAELGTSDRQVQALQLEVDANRRLLEVFLQRAKETDVQEDFQQADATVISRAAAPTEPSFPKRSLFGVAGVVLGMIASIAIVFALELSDRTFRSMEQVQRLTGYRALGLVPRERAAEKNVLRFVTEKPFSTFGEAMRRLFTKIQVMTQDPHDNVVVFTSAIPNEGKSSTTASMAAVASSLGKQVVIIDCDIRRPTIHQLFGLEANVGLVDYLRGEEELEDIIQTHPKSGVHVIARGAKCDNPMELIGSADMEQLLRALSQTYDLVILDTAPVLAVTETQSLIRMTNKTVMVVRWGSTNRNQVMAALNEIEEDIGEGMGVVLTQVDVKKNARYGYTDSGYYSQSLKKYYSN
ncbi:MAG: polysaccharide biosynthesis tyrosine autokinase [Pseudomonadota bacterium]